MRDDDIDMRRLPPAASFNSSIAGVQGNEKGHRSCQHPGPNQQGFDEYISVLDGPGAPRQNLLQVRSSLYSQGCGILVHNDQDVTVAYNKEHFNINGWLTKCEADHGMRMMNDSVAQNKPFYLQVWFHSPRK